MRTWTPIALIAGFFLAGCSLVVGKDGNPCESDNDCGDLNCVDGVCTDESACTDDCSPEGSKRCDPDGPDVQICSVNLDSCLNWIPDPDNRCEADQHCDPDSHTCVAGCVDYCTEGDYRCNQDAIIEVCVQPPDQCRAWQEVIDCAAEGKTCSDARCHGEAGTCDDMTENQDETDVDCGGESCQACGANRECHFDSDCVSEDCLTGVCEGGPSCNDGVKNQDETDRDCGGNTCLPCEESFICLVDGDCQSDNCAEGTCACQDECNNGDTTCQGSLLSNCSMMGACLQWAGTEQCSASSEVCVNMQCVVPGSCGTPPCNSPAPMFASMRNDTANLSPLGIDGGYYVEDSSRGLMWKRCPEGLEGIGCSGSRVDLPWQDAYEVCENLDYAGHQDWRLPDRFDLQSILQYGSEPIINTDLFPNTAALWYWTSSSDPRVPTQAWRIHSSTGLFETREKGDIPQGFIRCVRRMSAAKALPAIRFHRTSTDQPTATDAITDLIWQACPPSRSGPDCLQDTGVADTWKQAEAMGNYCYGLSWGAHPSGWRLPTTKELSSLVNDVYTNPLDAALGPLLANKVYISADIQPGNPQRPYAVDFTDGSVIVLFNMESAGNVRCVHDPD